MSDDVAPRPDSGPSVSTPKNRLPIILIAAILLCCGCLAALLIGQYLLENSDITLVKLLIAYASA